MSSGTQAKTTYKIGIDVGGTFTDIVLQDDTGAITQGKTSSIPGNESQAVMNAIGLMAEQVGLSAQELLARTRIVNFGTTVATNAMLEMKGVPVGLITTRGFRDIVDLRRGWKEVMFDLKLPPPPAIVRRRFRLGVTERITFDGSVVTPLAEDELRTQVRKLKAAGIQSIAVCFLFSFMNPAHERRAREVIAEEHPDAEVFLSSDTLPRIREFERFSTAVVNAFLSPLLKTYLARLKRELVTNGYRGQLYIMQSNGGTVSPELAGELGAGALLSGPAGGAVAASRLGGMCDAPNVIGVDMGGTSYDVSLIRDGTPHMRRGSWLNRQFVGLPMLDIHTIGAGGGSIAWIDPGGALRVGPQSTGARPGPACYGRGGDQAAVSDAFLCLGYLNPDYFLGGRMKLRRDLAEQAILKNVGIPMGMDLAEAAFSIMRIVNNNMANAIRNVSVARGLDPRDFALMSFGGAGSVTAGIQARDLGIKRLLVPRSASVLCALGELWSDLRVSQVLPLRTNADEVDVAALGAKLDELAAEHIAAFSDLPGVTEVRKDRSAEMHYYAQTHEVEVPIVQRGAQLGVDDWQGTLDRFHAVHRDRYAFDLRGKRHIEVLSVAQDVVGVRPWQAPAKSSGTGSPASAVKEQRLVCFDVDGKAQWMKTPVYDGGRIQVGAEIAGPAVIEEVDTTIVVHPGDTARLNGYNVFDISIQTEASDASATDKQIVAV
jgi:N-methylhydantoinase A